MFQMDRTVYDDALINDVKTPYKEPEDSRVAQAVSECFGVTLHFLIVHGDGRREVAVYSPTAATGAEIKDGDLVLGHVSEHHFVPLVKGKNPQRILMLRTCKL